jgi:DNA-binding FadR family transcriptional regulator
LGEVLGSESELIERYDVSRAILREAVRILEHHGAVRTKRGPRGGLIVTAPPGDAVVRSAQIFLDHENVDDRQLLDARMVVERACTRLAAERHTPATDSELRRVASLTKQDTHTIAPLMELHRGIATASGNRLFALFVGVIAELTGARLDALPPAERVTRAAEAQKAHDRIVAAIVAGDAEAAERSMTKHLRAASRMSTND